MYVIQFITVLQGGAMKVMKMIKMNILVQVIIHTQKIKNSYSYLIEDDVSVHISSVSSGNSLLDINSANDDEAPTHTLPGLSLFTHVSLS